MTDVTAPTGPGRPKDPAKRQAILEAAKNLFIRNGYANTSMDAVAAEAGVSKLTVYSHFTDKETLFSAAVVARCEEQVPELFVDMAPTASAEKVLLGIARGFQTLINSPESVELHRLMIALGTQGTELSQVFFEAGPQRILQEMERVLTRLNDTDGLHFDSPARAAGHFLSLIKGVGNFRLLIGHGTAAEQSSEDRHVREVVALFLKAYRA
ncbi:TetR/AcrR family transcriptional regulator [Pseudomonas sp. GD03842]|uniref:TetR/AcrR family transcriptional regulator n=1 Tax=Pseudomonas sp. GD03842 TaxID=2975385 RepID=UPI0024475860|nr:TetR/AcrR family transcriptional regulator [Pseudomonas sp. GD03842]MDH0747482.1 TetR/AcrR family transcriptional regulator [Pseudomonas sp. GD03842]